MDVIDSIFRELSAQKLGVLKRSRDMGEHLASLGLDDQSREAVTTMLAKELGNPVYVFDFLYASALVASRDGTLGRHSEESLAEDIWQAGTADFPGPPTRRAAFLNLLSRRALAASLIVGRKLQGRIVVPEDDSPLDEFAETAVSQAAELLSFLLMKRIAIVEGRREAASLFFDSLLSDALSHEDAAERAVTLGLRLSVQHVAVMIGLQQHWSEHSGMLSMLADQAFSAVPHAIGVIRGGRELLVVAETDDSATDVDGAIERLQELLASNKVVGLRAACGTGLPGLEGLRRSQKEAMIAYKTAERSRAKHVLRFEELGVERLLSQIPNDELAGEYVRRVLGPIREDTELLRTLEGYLEHRGNKVAAAAAFPLHRSSLMYRLDKISKLLGLDIDDPERFLELWLAVRLLRMQS
jgi:sugar diacid utilization regulator